MRDDKAIIGCVIIAGTTIALALSIWFRKMDERAIEQEIIAQFQGAWLQTSNGASFFPFESTDWTRVVQETPEMLIAITNILNTNEIFVILRSGISNVFMIQAEDFDALKAKDGVMVMTNAVWRKE